MGIYVANTSPENKFVTINVWDKITGKNIYSEQYPLNLFNHGGTYPAPGWVDLQVPGIVVNDDFYVEVVPPPGDNSPIRVIDYEEAFQPKRSFFTLGNGKSTEAAEYNWYIRVTGYIPQK